MGYKTKLFIGRVDIYPKRLPNWFQIFAMVDLCKCGFLKPINTIDGIPVYFFADDGNTKITVDRYDTPLVAYPIDLIKHDLKKLIKEDYARYSWAYEIIVAITKKRPGKHAQTATHCILFGH